MTYSEAINVRHALQEWHTDWKITIRTSGLTNSASYTLEVTKGRQVSVLTGVSEEALCQLECTMKTGATPCCITH